jgi:hypothetical protein
MYRFQYLEGNKSMDSGVLAQLISAGVVMAVEQIMIARSENRSYSLEDIIAEVKKTLEWELGKLPLPEEVDDAE